MWRVKPRQLPLCISQVCAPSPPRHDPTNDPVGERRHSELHNPVIPVFLQLRANQTPHFPCFVSPSTHYHSCVSGRKTEANMHHSIGSSSYAKHMVAETQLHTRVIPNGCRTQNAWRLQVKARLPPLVGGMRPACTDTAPLTPSTGTFIPLRRIRVVPGLGPKARPCAPFVINTSVRPSRIPQL